MASLEEEVNCVLRLAELKSVTAVQRRYGTHCNEEAPRRNSISKWMKKFQETGSVNDRPRSGRPDQLDFEDDDMEVDEKLFLYAVIVALRKMFGEIGASIPVCILKYVEEERRAFLRFPARDALKVYNALSVFSDYNGMSCAFKIFKMVPFLSSLNVQRMVVASQ